MRRKCVLMSVAMGLVAATLGITGATQAAVYSGRFDPIEFSGKFRITIPDICKSFDGWHANDENCASTLNIATATVESGAPGGYSGFLTFAPPEISDVYALFGVFIVNGSLDSFDTGRISYVPDADPVTTVSWDLQFSSGHAFESSEHAFETCSECGGPRFAAFVETPTVEQPPKGVYLYANGVQSGPATYTDITLVPEPATLPLLGGAVLAGWLLRRRPSSTMRG
jgi:PEP-CTERM motif-containing protein